MVTAVTVRIWWGHDRFRTVLGFRIIAALSAFVGLYQLIATQSQVWDADFDWDAYNSLTSDMMEFCTSSPYPMLNVSAVWEYVLVFGIMGTILSFWPEVVFDETSGEEE